MAPTTTLEVLDAPTVDAQVTFTCPYTAPDFSPAYTMSVLAMPTVLTDGQTVAVTGWIRLSPTSRLTRYASTYGSTARTIITQVLAGFPTARLATLAGQTAATATIVSTIKRVYDGYVVDANVTKWDLPTSATVPPPATSAPRPPTRRHYSRRPNCPSQPGRRELRRERDAAERAPRNPTTRVRPTTTSPPSEVDSALHAAE